MFDACACMYVMRAHVAALLQMCARMPACSLSKNFTQAISKSVSDCFNRVPISRCAFIDAEDFFWNINTVSRLMHPPFCLPKCQARISGMSPFLESSSANRGAISLLCDCKCSYFSPVCHNECEQICVVCK